MSVLWTAPDGTVFERVGECPPEQCKGRCCGSMFFGPFPNNPDHVAWAKLHDGLEVVETGDFVVLNFHNPCSALADDGKCSLYDTSERPSVCDEWPRSPADLLMTPYCGYSFEPLKEAAA